MTDLFLCSFASPDLKNSVKRFLKQSKTISQYKDTKVFGWDDLSLQKKKQIEFFLKNKSKRLYGYASWKPEIILSYLNFIPEDSILQYSDIGCHLNRHGTERLKKYLEIMQKNDILAFQYTDPKFLIDYKLNFQIYYEKEYTKEDLFKYFDIAKESIIRTSEQIWSGSMFLKNNTKTRELIKKWLDVCNISNLIDDSPSKEKNDERFIHHRHDQSVFSILCKLNNVICLSASECEWAEDTNGRFWDHLENYPIHAKRDKKLNFLKRFFLRQKKNIKRKINK